MPREMSTLSVRTESRRPFAYGLLYVSSIAAIAGLSSFLTVVAAKSWFPSGEAWEGAGLLWAFSVPSIVVLSALSWPVYVRYRRAHTMKATTLIYLANVIGILIGGFAATYGIVTLLGRLQ
jgi:hypothetical protein